MFEINQKNKNILKIFNADFYRYPKIEMVNRIRQNRYNKKIQAKGINIIMAITRVNLL